MNVARSNLAIAIRRLSGRCILLTWLLASIGLIVLACYLEPAVHTAQPPAVVAITLERHCMIQASHSQAPGNALVPWFAASSATDAEQNQLTDRQINNSHAIF